MFRIVCFVHVPSARRHCDKPTVLPVPKIISSLDPLKWSPLTGSCELSDFRVYAYCGFDAIALIKNVNCCVCLWWFLIGRVLHYAYEFGKYLLACIRWFEISYIIVFNDVCIIWCKQWQCCFTLIKILHNLYIDVIINRNIFPIHHGFFPLYTQWSYKD